MRTCCRVCKVDHQVAALTGQPPHLASCIHYIPDWRDQGRRNNPNSMFLMAGIAVPFDRFDCVEA